MFPLLIYYLNFYKEYIEVLLSILAIIAFSNYPDIDIKYKRGRLSKRLFYSFLMTPFFIYSLMFGKGKVAHRGITHSLTGTGIFSFFVLIVYLIFRYFKTEACAVYNFNLCYWNIDLIFYCIILSYLLHLIGDSLTKEGIKLAGRRIHGILITNKTDSLFVITFALSEFVFYFFLINEFKFFVLVSMVFDVAVISSVYALSLIR